MAADEPDTPSTSDREARGDRVGRVVATSLATAATAATAAGVVGMAVHYARRLTDPPSAIPEDPPADDDQVTVVAVGDGDALLVGPGADRPGVWGMTLPGGYARIGADRRPEGRGVRRSMEVLDAPVAPATGVLDAYAHVNRATDLAPHAREVSVAGAVGDLPAHTAPGDDTWVIGVHGRAALRHETFRMLGPVVARGHTAMAISYRNDHDAPASPDGRSHLGATEWEDVVAAMDHARGHGARRLVLLGCSMGGALVGQVLARADVGDVVGVILDAPVVDWHPVVSQAARDLGVPRLAVSLLVRPATAVARARHAVDLRALRFDPQVLDVPTLLVHGGDDAVVPPAGSDRLAATRADVVTYLRVPGAGHVRSWNVDPTTYDLAVDAFLGRVLR